MPAKKLKEFLNANEVKYVSIVHSVAYTAQEIAASAHIKGKALAKTVILKIDGKLTMAVLPANYKIDFDLLKDAFGSKDVRLSNEQEFKDKFPGCEVGAMPPFGNLYDVDTYVAASLIEDKEISFNAGTHTELIKMQYKDYKNLVKPKVIRFSSKHKN